MIQTTNPPKLKDEPTIPEDIKKDLMIDAMLTVLLPGTIDKAGDAGRLSDGTTLSLVEGTKEHRELNEITHFQGVEITEKIEPSVMRGALKKEI